MPLASVAGRSQKTERTWTTTSTTAHERIEQYNKRPEKIKPAKDPIFTALAYRSYHIPTYGWCEDWLQYFANNHPLFGICCHHPRHPIGTPMRLVNLLASILFGLLVTNVIWLFFVLNEEHDADNALVTIAVGGQALNSTRLESVNEGSNQIQITEGVVMLWTLGGGLHAVFDNTVWYLSACVCCLPCHSEESLERFQKYGSTFMIFAVLCIGAVASFCVVLRASLEDDYEEENGNTTIASAGLSDDQVDLLGFSDKSSFDFLLSYAIELALALFIYFPIVGTILFSGFLGCGKVPLLGGRPYEYAQEQRRIERKQRRAARREQGDLTENSSSSTPCNRV